MATRHQFPCPLCDEPVNVESTQAGQLIKCRSCKESIKVPKLRDLRGAPVEEPEAQPTRSVAKSSQWTGAQRWTFVGGLLVAAIAGVVGALFHFNAASLVTEIEPYFLEPRMERRFENLSPVELIRAWDEMTSVAPGNWVEDEVYVNERRAEMLRLFRNVLWGIAGAGVITMGVSFFLRE